MVFVVLYCMHLFWWFNTSPPKINGRSHRKENTNFPKWRWVHSKNVCLSSALLFSLVVTKENCFENFLRSLYLEQYVFFVRMQSQVSAAPDFEGYVWLLWLFTSCVWDVLCYRILIKTAFVSWAKWKPSKTTLSTFQKCFFELCWACFFGGN